jgi:hypothetical protein
MKLLIQAVIAAAVFVAPAVTFAQQSDAPVTTRAQVRAELIQIEQAGYRPGDGDQTSYPDAVQAAEARVGAQNGGATGYGGMVSGSSSSGAPAALRPTSDDGMKAIYFGN